MLLCESLLNWLFDSEEKSSSKQPLLKSSIKIVYGTAYVPIIPPFVPKQQIRIPAISTVLVVEDPVSPPLPPYIQPRCLGKLRNDHPFYVDQSTQPSAFTRTNLNGNGRGAISRAR